MKLQHYTKTALGKVQWVKELFIHEVSNYQQSSTSHLTLIDCTLCTTPQPAAQDPQNTPSWQQQDHSHLMFTASPDEVLRFIQLSATLECNLKDEVQTDTSSIQYWQASPIP